MELVDGGTLRDLLDEQGPLDVALALSVAEPVLSALAAAHRAGLVHRDVKPENVLIGRSGPHTGGVVKVADFGLVRAVASAGTTSSSVILGTVAYLSPEQVDTGAATRAATSTRPASCSTRCSPGRRPTPATPRSRWPTGT